MKETYVFEKRLGKKTSTYGKRIKKRVS